MSTAVRMTILANAAQAKKELDSFAGTAEKSTGRVGSTLAKFGKVAALGAAAAGVAVAGFAVSAVKSASDSQQSLGATETVFGKFAKNVVKTSDDAAKKYGLSANTYRENANLIGSLFKNQGVATDQLAGKTEKIVGVGADLAATFGGTTTDAVGALGAAFKGEFDSLEKYGISLKESTISAELAARGQDKLTGAALAAAKQQVTSDLIMKQSTSAQGAFARETDTLAHQQQVLGAQFENVKAKVGSALLPVLTAAAQFLNDQLFPAVEKMLPSIKAFAEELGAKLAPVIATVAAFITGTLAPALSKFGGYIIGTVVPAVASLVSKLASNLRPVFEAVAEVVKKVQAKFKEWQPTIQQTVEVVGKIIGKVLEFASKVIAFVLPIIIKLQTFLAIHLFNAVVIAIQVIGKIIGKVIEFGGTVIDGAQKVGEFASKVGQKITDVIRFFVDLPSKIKNALTGAGEWLVETGKNIIRGLVSGLEAAKQWVIDKIQEIADVIPGWVKRRLGIASPSKVTTYLGRMAGEGLAVGLDGAKATVEKAAERLTNTITTALDKVYNGKKLDKHTKQVQQSLRDEVRAVNQAASAYDKIKERLVEAKETLGELVQQSRDYAASVKQGVVDFGSVVGLGLREDAEGNQIGASASSIIEDLRKKAIDAARWTTLIAGLTKDQLNETSLQQLMAAGVEGGLATAEAIAAGGAGAIAEINTLTAQIGAAGAQVGNSTAQTFYGEGVNAAAQMVLGVQQELNTQGIALTAAMGVLGMAAQDGLVKGLTDSDKLKKTAKAIAKEIKDEVKKALGIKSPSRVFMKIGRQTAQGLVVGLRSVPVDRAALRMADALQSGFSAPDLRASLDTSAVAAFNTASANSHKPMTLHLTSDAVDRLTRGREVRADLDAYERAGGRQSA